MENTEIAEVKQETEVSTCNAFANTEAFNNLYKMGKMLASSDLVPAAYHNKATDCAIAIDMANRMNVSPMFVMQNLYVVKGKPSWSGQACMSMIKASPLFKEVKPVYTGEKNTDTWGCYVQAIRTSDGETVKGAEVSIKMAKDEGWYGKPGSKWQTMPELMLAYRAAAFFARVHIPNSLMGCSVEGEVEDMQKQELPAPPNPLSNTRDEEIRKEEEKVFR